MTCNFGRAAVTPGTKLFFIVLWIIRRRSHDILLGYLCRFFLHSSCACCVSRDECPIGCDSSNNS